MKKLKVSWSIIMVGLLLSSQVAYAGQQKPGQKEGQQISIQNALQDTGKRTFTGATMAKSSFPLAGIGTGIIHFDGSVMPNKWDIGHLGDQLLMNTNSLFAISVTHDNNTTSRVLQTGHADCFDNQPTNSTRRSFNKQGTYFIGTTEVPGGVTYDDGPIGSIKSDVFTIPANCAKVTALVGGGNNIANLYLGLFKASDNSIIGKVTGHNSEYMHNKTITVSSSLSGEQVYFAIVDGASGGWGHINIDNIQLKNAANTVLSSDFFNGNFESGSLNGWNISSLNAMEAYASTEATFEYPLARYAFEDEAVPVDVELEMFSPMVPLNERDSCLPTGVFNIKLTNTLDERVSVSVLSTLANGLYGSSRTNTATNDSYGKYITMTSSGYIDGTNQEGSLCLQTSADNATYHAGATSASVLLDQVNATGQLDGTGTGNASNPVAGVSAPVTLAAGETKTVTFTWSWYFPHFKGSQLWGSDPTDISRRYCEHYDNVEDVMKDVVDRKMDLVDKTILYHDTMYDSNLPYYLLDAVATTMDVMRSATFYYTKDGDVYAWEGSCGGGGSGCCQGNCTHVYNYVEGMPHMFPALARKWKEMDYDYNQLPNGWVNNRFTSVPARNSIRSSDKWYAPAFDGNAGSVAGAYREHLNSVDSSFLTAYWPKIKKQMDGMIALCDSDEDGINSDIGYMTTYDQPMKGQSTITTGQYHVALRAAEEMAKVMGDTASATRYHNIYASGSKKLDENTFNGEYYEHVGGGGVDLDYNTANMTDQLLGQAYAHLNGLGYLMNESHTKSAAHSIFKYNFFHEVAQSEIDDVPPGASNARYLQRAGEDLLFIARQPKGGTIYSSQGYTSEDMTGFSYKAATELMYEGYTDEALTIVKAIRDRFDGIHFNPLDEVECGCYYLRSMASYGVLVAATGIEKNGPAKMIGFNPHLQEDNIRAFYCSVSGWGTFEQTRNQSANSLTQVNTIDVKDGYHDVNTLQLYYPENLLGVNQVAVNVTLDGNQVATTFVVTDNQIKIALPTGTRVNANSVMVATITLNYDGTYAPEICEDFNEGNLENWNIKSGTWNNTGASVVGTGLDVWLMHDLDGTDFTYEADVKLNSGSSILRFRSTANGDDGYALAIEPNDVKLYKFPYVPFKVVQVSNTLNKWYHVKIVQSGNNTKVYFDGSETPMIDWDDSTYTSGKFGVGAYGDSEFDNIVIDLD